MNDRSSDSPTSPSFAGTLATIRDRTPRALVSGPAWVRLEAVARRLPAQLVSRFYLECRLAAGDARADLIVGVEEPGRALLAGSHPAVQMPRDLMASAVWRALGSLCRARHGADRALGRRIRRFWVELDLDDAARDALAAPRLFVDWQPDDAAGSRQALVELLDRYPDLAGGALDDASHLRLRQALVMLPPSAVLFSVGFHPRARGASRVRLCVHDTLDRLDAWIASFDERATVRTWARLRSTLGGHGEVFAERWLLHLDLTASSVVGLGIEVGLRRCRRQDLARHPTLDRLVGEGLASGGKRTALATWPGASTVTLPHEVWRSRTVRFVNHLKLAAPVDGTPVAKAYLCHARAPDVRRRARVRSSQGSIG